MELHVYYYPILILFLANSASAILHRQKELQSLGDLFGVTSDPDDNLDSIFQDQPQQSLRQQPGLNFGNFDDLNQFLNPQKTKANRFFYHDHEDHDHEENCEQKVVPLDDVVKIVKIIFEKLPSICVSRLKVCGSYPGTPNPYPKPPYKPEDPYHKPHHHHHHHHHKQKSNLYKNMKQNPLFVRSMDSVNSNSTYEDGNDETSYRDGQSTDFEEGNTREGQSTGFGEGNGEEGKERSKRSTGEEDYPPHYDNYYQAYNDYNNPHPYHYGGYQNSYHPYDYSHHYNSPYDGSFYLDPYDQGVRHYQDYLHHKHVNENYPNRNIYLDPYDQSVKNYMNYLHHKSVNEKYPNSAGIVFF